MDWEKFKKLEINKQVELINNLIKEHGSITKASKEFKRSDKTIREHFKTLGYRFIDGLYVKNTNTPLDNKTSLAERSGENKEETNMLMLEQIVDKIVEKKINEISKTKKIDFIELSSKCDGKVKYRSLGVYINVLNEFIPYCKTKKPYTLIQLLSQAMIEFMENHK